MGTFCRHSALSAACFLGLALAGRVVAAADAPGLYDQPVLVLEPGRHTASIRRADVSATGAYAVTGADDKTVRLWEVSTGQLLRTIRLPQGPGNIGKVYAVAISPDGTLVAAGGWTGATGQPKQIYLFDRATGALVQRLAGVPNVVHHLVFSPTGQYLATTLGGTHGLRVYDRDAGWSERARDATYGASSYGAAFAADGRLATTSVDGHLRLYDRAFQRVATVTAPDGTQPYGLAFTPTGDRLAVGYYDTPAVSLMDGHTLAPLSSPPTQGLDNGSLSQVAWSADGTTLYAGGPYGRTGTRPVVAWAAAGAGPRRELGAGRDAPMSLRPLADGGVLVGAQDPWLAVLDAAGAPRWVQRPPQADLRGPPRTLRVSAEGHVVDFGYEAGGEVPARFDLTRLALRLEPPQDGQTRPPEQTTLPVDNWANTDRPALQGTPLALMPYERSRSLAIHPDGRRFVLGTDWRLRAFAADGTPLWQQAVPDVVWAVNLTADGRLVVAAHGDGTLRWHRMDDGRELLALFLLADRTNWVAWTPEGVYAATPGAYGVLRWHVNRGWDAPAEAIPVAEIPGTHRPAVIRLVLQEGGTKGAIGVAELAEIRAAIQRRTGAAVPPGTRLHVLTVGVSDYGTAATHLRLAFAAADANDVAAALLNTQDSLYAKVSPQRLTNQDATREGILRGLATMRAAMARSERGRDLAVVHFSGHGALVDGEFYLLPHDVKVGDPVAIKHTALSASALRQELEGLAQYGRVLVLLDACRSGGAMAAGQALAVDATRLRTALVGPNITVLTSSTAEQLSREDPQWGNGAFTEIVLEALSSRADADKNGMISISELTGYLTRHVPGLTGGAQQPGVEMRFDGDVFVAGF
jgi:DNA-binding beta-propeller fold protein YncE